MFSDLNNLLDGYLRRGVPGFICKVLRNGELIYERVAGFSDREARKPMLGNERFNLYSCSKVITCTAALQLLERGAFALDDEIWRFLPEFENMTRLADDGQSVPANNKITIRHLFAMTSGLDYELHTPELDDLIRTSNGRCPTREACRRIARRALLFEPGTQFQYGLSHDVLAVLIETVSGQPFNDYVTDHIFRPLGMQNSTYLPTEDDVLSLTPQYRYQAGSQKVVRISTANDFRIGSQYASGGAGCVSTIDDYLKFMEGLRTGKLIKPETVRLMATDQLHGLPGYFLDEQYGYGLGVRCPKPGSDRRDFGWDGAAGAFMAILPQEGISICYLQHMRETPFLRNELAAPGLWV